MNLYIGIDLGTSALKLLLMDAAGNILNTVTKEYPLEFPHPGWSQQAPEDWKNAIFTGIPELLKGFDKSSVRGIGAGGQMHGLVVLDAKDNVIRPAILWNDGRTSREVSWLNNKIGKEKLSSLTANIAFAGFTAPKLLWMKNNEPELFRRISKIMLPKDYVNYCLIGIHSCDYSDASGMLLLDVENRCWSEEMLNICGISLEQMPKLYESYAPVGCVKPEIAKLLGIPANTVVAAGAGDNAAAAVGTGVVGEGGCNISLGTSGTVFISSEKFGVDSSNSLHAFAHADGGYHLMGCMLSAASCNKWLMENIYETEDYSAEQFKISANKLGENTVYFLPYLMGERSPINDTNARGTFIGMTMDTSRADMTLAVLEGVAFALRDSVEVAKSIGIAIPASMLCGGGAKSALWKKILCNVLNIPLMVPVSEQGPGMGGAMLSMVACGEYSSVAEVCLAFVHVSETITPDKDLAAKYENKYRHFQKIYPACKDLFAVLGKE